MAMDAGEIERLIKASIPDAHVTIRDLAGDGDHYAATVVSASFKGKSRVQQHQLVYQALKGQMGGVLHALALGWRGELRYIYRQRRRSRSAPAARRAGPPTGQDPWESSNSSTMKSKATTSCCS